MAEEMKPQEQYTNRITDVLEQVEPLDELEENHIAQTLAFISSNGDGKGLFRDINPAKHLVCYTPLYDPHQKLLLFLEHKKSGLFASAGGHVDINELPWNTAAREIYEELGIEANPVSGKAPFFITNVQTELRPNMPVHTDVDLWYPFAWNANDPIPGGVDFEREFGNHRWLDFEEIMQIEDGVTDMHMKRFASKLFKNNAL